VFKPDNRQAYLTHGQAENIVDLPHDFSVGMRRDPSARTLNSCGFFPGGIAYYEKRFPVNVEWRDKRVFLLFEGVYMNAAVRINQQMAARHPYGYTSFICELTDHLLPGEDNHISLCVNNDASPNSRWYSGSGIYRPVWLIIKDRLSIDNWGVFAYTESLSEQSAAMRVRTRLSNARHAPVDILLRSSLERDGQTVAAAEVSHRITEGSQTELTQLIMVDNPMPWSVDLPNLYILRSELFEDGQLVDSEETTVGLRTISVDASSGFQLNGKPLKMRGGCVHHDCGLLGAAARGDAEERKVMLLKNNGFNAVRCAHNPPSPAFLDACDRLGMLVIDEAFDAWTVEKMAADYAMFFNEWWQRDLASMVLRDRNHPSVVMWSTGNEICERDGRSNGYATARALAAFVRSLDHTRAITNALCGIPEPGQKGGLPAALRPDTDDVWDALTQDFAKPLDVVGYNYMYERYEKDTARHPGRVICGTETFPAKAYETWRETERFTNVIGDFVWTALDYLGEAGIGRVTYQQEDAFCGDYPWHQAYCGDIDICGFKRPQSYYRDCVWGRADNPYIAVYKPQHYGKPVYMKAWGWPDVTDSWTWRGFEGKPIQVDVYSIDDEVELFLNGRSVGRKPCGEAERFTASFDITYEPGTLKAVGHRNGVARAETILTTVGKPAAVRLTAEKARVPATFGALAFVMAEAVDDRGRRVPDAAVTLQFSVSGPGSLLAVGSGDPVSEEAYVGDTRSVHEGRAMVVVKCHGEPGAVTLAARAEGLAAGIAVITVG
jgi:beta-galactosidase